jgi:hypothetical protein
MRLAAAVSGRRVQFNAIAEHVYRALSRQL